MKMKHLIYLLLLFSASVYPQKQFTVKLDDAENGSYTVSPTIPEDGKCNEGAVLTIKTYPQKGYVLDAGYFAAPGKWGADVL